MNISTVNAYFFCIYQVLVYITSILKLVRCNACPLAQVGSNYTFNGTFQHTIDAPLKIVWLKDGSDVSYCIPGIGCSDNNERETLTSLRHLEIRNYKFQLFINNITSKEAGHWSLEYFGPALSKYPAPIFRCQLGLQTNTFCTKKDEIIKQSTMITVQTSMLKQESTITTLTLSSTRETTRTKHPNIGNEQKEPVVLIVALGVVSFVLVLVLTTFFLVFRCRVKIYARFTRHKQRSSQFSTHVYESIEDIKNSSQTAVNANSSVVLTNETSNECYITVI